MKFSIIAKVVITSAFLLSVAPSFVKVARADSNQPAPSSVSTNNTNNSQHHAGQGSCAGDLIGNSAANESSDFSQQPHPTREGSSANAADCSTRNMQQNSNSGASSEVKDSGNSHSTSGASGTGIGFGGKAVSGPSSANSGATGGSNGNQTQTGAPVTLDASSHDNSVNSHRVDARVDGRVFDTSATVYSGQDVAEGFMIIAECDEHGKIVFRIVKTFSASNAQNVKNISANFSLFGGLGIGGHYATSKTSNLAEVNAKFARVSSVLGQMSYYQTGQARTSYTAVKYLALAAGMTSAEAEELANSVKAAGDNYTQKNLSCSAPSREVPNTPSVSILTPPTTPQKVKKGAADFELTPSQLKESVKTFSF